jgi:Cdc25 family phosphatase
MADVSYIEALELADKIVAGDNLLVIDVRDDDFDGIKVKGAVNIPSADFDDFDFVDEQLDNWRQYDTIVFHCMLSQVRGPRIANLVSRRIQMQQEEGDSSSAVPDVKVLIGGWMGWQRSFGDDEDLVERET